jgi:hypothetical protein
MAGGLERRLTHLELVSGITAPDHMHIILTDYFALGSAIAPCRLEQRGQPDLVLITQRRLYDDILGEALNGAGNAPARG